MKLKQLALEIGTAINKDASETQRRSLGVSKLVEINKGWTVDSIRTLMSRGSEVEQLDNGDYVLTNKTTKVFKVKL